MHMGVSVRGLEDRVLGKINSNRYGTWKVFVDDNGRYLTKLEVIKLIEEHKKLGHEVITTCDNVDEKGHCRGHEEKLGVDK